MRHYTFRIDTLRVAGVDMPSVGGHLMVAQMEDDAQIDWELIHKSSEEVPLQMSPYDLAMSGPEGDLAGPALLVRSDGTAHVFRGAGELIGFGSFDDWLPTA